MIRTERSAIGFRDHLFLPPTPPTVCGSPRRITRVKCALCRHPPKNKDSPGEFVENRQKKTEQNVQLILDFTLWTFDMGIFVVLFEGDVYVQDFGRKGTDKIQIHLFGKTIPKKMALGLPKGYVASLIS